MSDHSGTTTYRFFEDPRRVGWRVLCRCGWQSEWSDSQDAVEALHGAHAELAEPQPAQFWSTEEAG